MNNFVETEGLVLPNADLLVRQVSQIENTLPGWWWSLSFTETNIRLTMGPDKNVPDTKHLNWMHSREGDFGLSHTVYSHGSERKAILDMVVATMLQQILGRLRHLGVDNRPWGAIGIPPIVLSPDVKYRYQHPADLNNLKVQYQRLVDKLDFIRKSEFIITEFYIGSCGLTADCSIRGGDDEHAFDCTGDLHNGNIGDAIEVALGDLLADIDAIDPGTVSR